MPLLKPIVGLPGDEVCITATTVRVNQQVLGPVFLMDRQGQPLPVWRGCRILAADELFPLSTRLPTSFDGRYFGPIRITDVLGIARPLWTWEG
jgi:conjugative transfer signal peptidase TraF